jgi:hypothetical protein
MKLIAKIDTPITIAERNRLFAQQDSFILTFKYHGI